MTDAPPPLLEIDAVAKRLGARRVLDGVTLRLAPGELAVLLGPNGSGKSTLLRVVAGVLAPDAGDVRLEGRSIVGARALGRRRLGYLPEAAEPLPQLTPAELVALVAALKGCAPPAAALIERLGLAGALDQRIGSLSLGQRRRACLLAALVGAPAVLVLDEPTNGLDPAGVDLLLLLLAEQRAAGGAALLATHDLDFARALAGRTVALQAGRIQPENLG